MNQRAIATNNSRKKLISQMEGITHTGIKDFLSRAKAHMEKDDYRLARDEFAQAANAVDVVGLKITLLKMAARASAAESRSKYCEFAAHLMDEAAMLKMEAGNENDSGAREMEMGKKLREKANNMGVREFLSGMGGYGLY